MNLSMLLEMAESAQGDRVVIGALSDGWSAGRLRDGAGAGADRLADADCDVLVFMGGNGPAFPLALFAAARAGVPLLPLNYRAAREHLLFALRQHERPFVVTDDAELAAAGHRSLTVADWVDLGGRGGAATADAAPDPDEVALLLMTSGTTSTPKSAVLRHRNLVSYVLETVEFASAAPDEAILVSVPPYHIAAVANLLSNLYSGRRIVYLENFTPEGWLESVARESVTHAMVVPTMLSRIVDVLSSGGGPFPESLRSISYGGAKISPTVLERALTLLPDVGFVNAYGLTETSSSIAVLGPDDHREALVSTDPAVQARLESVGRPLPSVEISIRRPDGAECLPGELGEIHVRGAQVAGEYRGRSGGTGPDGWFATRDEGHLDPAGYLFVRGRADDTIIRGGENIAPAEIEAVLQRFPGVKDAAVVGLPDPEWGQVIAAFVVPEHGHELDARTIREHVRSRLRSSRTPDTVHFLDALPTTATGKILRRELPALLPGEA